MKIQIILKPKKLFKIEDIKSLDYIVGSKTLTIYFKEKRNIKNFNTDRIKLNDISIERFEKLLKEYNLSKI